MFIQYKDGTKLGIMDSTICAFTLLGRHTVQFDTINKTYSVSQSDVTEDDWSLLLKQLFNEEGA